MTFLDEPQRLPLIPEPLRRKHEIHQPLDSRFKAAARLGQSLWRERKGLGMGSYTSAGGRRRKLGSQLDREGVANGANIMDPAVRYLTHREIWYRERGACVDEARVWSNLLSSMPMTFNVLGPLKNDRNLASRVINLLFPDMAGSVCHIAFEHSPGRGDENFIGDGSAYDGFISVRTVDGRKMFVGVETKYSECMAETPARHRPLYDEVSRHCGLFKDPDSPELRSNPVEQLWRLHMLAAQIVKSGLYDGGVFMLVGPSLNDDVQNAAKRYRSLLATGDDLTPFANVPLEHLLEVMKEAGGDVVELQDRYCNWQPVHDAVDNYLIGATVQAA